MSRLSAWLLLPALLLLGACKNPEEAAAERTAKQLAAQLARGQSAMEQGDYRAAVDAYRAASHLTPEPEPMLLLADVYRQQGNRSAAVVTLQELERRGRSTPEVRRQIIDLYLEVNAKDLAFKGLESLRDARLLTEPELIAFARMLAKSGRIPDAFTTIEPILDINPDDPEAKTLEAEILLLQGEELLATKLLDRLLKEHPNLAAARLLRARYFFNNGYPQYAEADLANLPKDAALGLDTVKLHARVLNALGREEETEALLNKAMAAEGRTPELLAMLAETKLQLDLSIDAQSLVDEALQRNPEDPQAHYMRGLILEREAQPQQARAAFERALSSTADFQPALSRLWRLQEDAGQKRAAVDTLERLYFLGEATTAEKAALAGLYVELGLHAKRAKTLIEEALRREPDNASWKAIRTTLAREEARKRQRRLPMIIR
ncbi:MAG TPA: tetratricopeptide repeat protein [Myxococcaceae bacterium]|nr:tetratricopeptide repeat protein [Myxococcaceae bacterium]